MSQIESIKCDGCGEELITDTPYPHKFSLLLSVIDTNRNSTNMQYLIAQYPPFEGTRHFCGKDCLKKWLEEGN